MGAVLALRFIVCGLGLLILASCGTAADGPVVHAVQSSAQKLLKPEAEKPSLAGRKAAVLRDVERAGGTDPVLLVELPDLDAVASLVIAAKNGTAITWIDPSGVSVVTQHGIVIATRGLGHDLMAADVSGTFSALSGGPNTYQRVHRYLDGEGQLGRQEFQCEAEKTDTGVAETCRGGLTVFDNSFILKAGQVVRSDQWLGPEIGIARLTNLR